MITIIVKCIIAISFSFFAALAASKSVLNESGENEKISWQAFLLTMAPGLVMLAISLIFPQAAFPFIVVLAILVILQILNKRGGAQTRCWIYLALLAAFFAWWGMSAANDAAYAQAKEVAEQTAEQIKATGGTVNQINAARNNIDPQYSFGFIHTVIMLVFLASVLIVGLANWILHSRTSGKVVAKKSDESQTTVRAAGSACAATVMVIVSIIWITVGG